MKVRTLLTAALSAALALSVAPSAQAASGERLTFLSFNVCKSECASPAPSWDVRRDRVARVIAESGASVVGVQEATNWSVTHAKTQWDDIQNLVTPAGYVSATPVERFNDCSYRKGRVCTNSPRLLWKASEVTGLTTPDGTPLAGYTTLGAIAPGIEASAASRAVAWAYLQGGRTGPFLALSMHMPTEKDAIREQARVAVANGLDQWIATLGQVTGMRVATTVLMADLNSYDIRQPQGAQTVLKSAGWQDAWTAPSRRNITFSTINMAPDIAHFGGWPTKPRPYKRPATRIDYILAKGPVRFVDYEVMLWLRPDGTFDPAYQASDHQAVRAVIEF